ncbi:MAG: hypothetical protein ABIT38_00525 [Gemmatimonadaceae bacterium]
MSKRDEPESRGKRATPKASDKIDLPSALPPAERATSPPRVDERAPNVAHALSVEESGLGPSATAIDSISVDLLPPVTPRDALMTTPTFPSDVTNRLRTIDGRYPRRREVLSVQPPSETPDGFVAKSVIALSQVAGGDAKVTDINDRLLSDGLVEAVGKATSRLNVGGINRTQRLLLSIRPVYASIIEVAMSPASSPQTGGPTPTLSATVAPLIAIRRRVDFDDIEGLVDFIQRALDTTDGFREKYAGMLVDGVVELRGLKLDSAVRSAVVSDVAAAEIPILAARADEFIMSLIGERRSTLSLDSAVDEFALSGEVDAVRFTPRIRRAMVSFLQGLGVIFPPGGVTPQNRRRFDEYFALAYNHALRVGDGSTTDPIDAVRQKGAIADWDFTVDTFETVEEQGVVAQNILAAGALDYVYNLGERLGMFKLADALVLRWASGAFDAEPGIASADLYRYWKLRSERISPEERAMMYRRILMKGEGKLLTGMVENDQFPELWGTLMEKATDFIRRSEENASKDRTVSRTPIFQSTKQLQYNLTEHATGMAHMQITEMYHHLLEAKTVLEHAINFFSTGSRKSLWTVIERASREWFDEAPNISAIRSAAVDGNRIFQWIATFDQASVTDESFQGFLDASEAWIIAQATDDSAPIAADEQNVDQDDPDLNAADDDWDK